MKKALYLAIFQLVLSAVSAYLLSKMSFVGRLGINLFHKEYKILKSPVETFFLVFAIEILAIIILQTVYTLFNKKITNLTAVLMLLIGIAGLGFTVYDFTYEFSHKLLKTKFHIGFYLIWIGIIITSIYYLILPKRNSIKIIQDEIIEQN